MVSEVGSAGKQKKTRQPKFKIIYILAQNHQKLSSSSEDEKRIGDIGKWSDKCER